MTHVAHWDDVEERRLELGALQAIWQDLGRAAGMVDASVKRERIEPGCRPTPVHAHGRDEEFFFVLGGSGLSWQDGVTHEIGPGDCLFHPAPGPTHTLIAGEEGLEVLVFGPEAQTSGTWLPRAGVFWHGPWWLADVAGPVHPFAREPVEIEGRPGERPPTTIQLSEGIEREMSHGRTDLVWRDIGRATGSVTTGLRHATVAPGADGPPPHCHSAEHELFVVLDGEGVVTIGEEEHPVRRGHVIGRPAGTGVPHQMRAGDDGLSFLAWGTRDPSDMCWYPRSQKVSLRGLGVVARVEQVGYWDGEDG